MPEKGEMIRTFIAVSVPDVVRERIGRFQTVLRKHGANIKWIRPGSIHITLKFLGDVHTSRIELIAAAVHSAVWESEVFTVSISGTGTFPNDRRPRVLWLGISEGKEELSKLAVKTDEALTDLGFEREKRPYSPHLTMGRVRSEKGIQSTVDAMHQSGFDGGSFEVNDVFVMRSELKSTGAVYTVLEVIKLQG